MLYKFDILFKKNLSNGGVKVVTYSTLLQNPKTFGCSESLTGIVGQLSMVLEGTERDYSINTLTQKYYEQLIGCSNANAFGRQFPVRFYMTDAHDTASLQMEVKDDDGHQYVPQVHILTLQGRNIYDLRDCNTCVCIVCQQGTCTLIDDCGVQIRLIPGQLVFCAATVQELAIEAEETKLIWLQ